MGAYDAIAIDLCKTLCNKYPLDQTLNPTGEGSWKLDTGTKGPACNEFEPDRAVSIKTYHRRTVTRTVSTRTPDELTSFNLRADY
jgi:hypothetical protein